MMESQILLEGELSEHSVPQLLNYLYDQEATGRLVLIQEGVNKTIYLIQGNSVNVESSLRDETLGRYLVKQGRISEENFEKSLELMMSEGIQQGTSLVKLGLLGAKELYQAVKDQTRQKLLSAFSFQEGKYRFYSESEFIEKIYRFEFPFHKILRDGVYQYFSERVLEEELKKVEAGALIFLEGHQERIKLFDFDEQELEFISQIDEKKGLFQLIKLSSNYPFAIKLIYIFLLCGLVGPDGVLANRLRSVLPGEEETLTRQEGILISQDAPELVEEVEEEKESPDKILEFYIQIKAKDYFQLLELNEDATDDEVEQAYRRRLNEFERSRFPAQLDGELEAKLEEINTEIIKAYEAVREKNKRERYINQLKEKMERKKREAQKPLEAEKFLQEGIKYVRARDFANAQKMFEKAVELKPNEPEYYGYLGWTIFCNPELELEERIRRAKEKILQAIKMNPNMDSAHVFLGKILKEEGKNEEAIQEFKEAIRCNPNCKEAHRELEVHGVKL